jgi:hypothetical protein
MATLYKYTLSKIKLNLLKFIKKVNDKNMEPNFWTIVDRSDFKPLKKSIIKNKKIIKLNIHSLKEITDFIINKKTEYYKNKRFAEIKINFHDIVIEKCEDIRDYKKIKNKPIITIIVIIYPTNNFGKISLLEKKELKVNYYISDLRNMIFKMKNIEVLMRLLSDNVVCIDQSSMEISYSDLSVISSKK